VAIEADDETQIPPPATGEEFVGGRLVMDGRYEQPVVVPQVMHPTCRSRDVSSVHISMILQGLLSARHALCEPLDNGTRTEHGHSESPAPLKFRDLLVAPTAFDAFCTQQFCEVITSRRRPRAS